MDDTGNRYPVISNTVHILFPVKHCVNVHDKQVLYPSLRVSLPEGKEEIVGNLPPGSIRPSCMEALNLQIDGHLSPDLTAEGDCLTKFASQFAIGALE